MYRLLVWTSKGGTGKTTTVANMGPELARLGYRVLMVGCDPQGDLGTTFGVDPDNPGVTPLEALLGGNGNTDGAAVGAEAAVIGIPLPGPAGRPTWQQGSGGGRLGLIACSPALLGRTATLAAGDDYGALDRLLFSLDDDVDIALIDTQGALTPLSRMAAFAADGVLFVGEAGFYEARALSIRLGELDELSAAAGRAIRAIGLVFVRTSARSRRMRHYAAHFSDPELFGSIPLYVFGAHTRQQATVHDHPGFGQPTVFAEPDSPVAADYRALASELAERLAALAAEELPRT